MLVVALLVLGRATTFDQETAPAETDRRAEAGVGAEIIDAEDDKDADEDGGDDDDDVGTGHALSRGVWLRPTLRE